MGWVCLTSLGRFSLCDIASEVVFFGRAFWSSFDSIDMHGKGELIRRALADLPPEERAPLQHPDARPITNMIEHAAETAHGPQDWADGLGAQIDKGNGTPKCDGQRIIYQLPLTR